MNNHTRITTPSGISGADLCRAAIAEARRIKTDQDLLRREQLEAEIKAEREFKNLHKSRIEQPNPTTEDSLEGHA